ncbi:hypothetical protein JCM11251_006977 [Rhodosporidiobolus azoricus]
MSGSLDLVPGYSLGPFHLGSMLFNVLNHLRTYRSAYPNAKIAWDDENPSTGPLHLILSSPPLHLLFSPLTQRLSRIEVASTTSHPSPGQWVTYRGRPLQREGDDEEEDTVKVVRRAMGPTYGSSKVEGDEATGGGREEMLSYPGVAFGVLSGPSGSTLSRIVLTPLPSPANIPVDRAWLHPILPPSPSSAAGDLALAEIYLDAANLPTRALLHFHGSSDEDNSPAPFELRISETTSEDILSELGGAIRTFWKEDDRMSIHTASLGGGVSPASSYGNGAAGPADDPSLSPNPYFLSFPHLGLTLLLTSSPTPRPLVPSSRFSTLIPPHTLLKIILHSNLPGESNFGRTARAVWVFKREGGEGGGSLGGVEDGWERVRGVLRRKGTGAGTAVSAGEREPSPPSSPSSSSVAGSGTRATEASGTAAVGKKKSKKGAVKVREMGVENLLGLSTFDEGGRGTSPSSLAVPRPSVNSTADDQHQEEEGEEEEEKPMILDHGADGGGGGYGVSVGAGGGADGGTRSGAGRGKTTEIHGFPGIALEVTQEGEVETVWLF